MRTKDRFHSGGLTSFGGHVLSKRPNILLIALLAAKSVPAKEQHDEGQPDSPYQQGPIASPPPTHTERIQLSAEQWLCK